MTRILIPTDISEGSRKAVLFALDAYGIAETEFIFLLTIGDAPKMGLFPEFNTHMKRLAQEELNELTTEIRALHPGETMHISTAVGTGSVFSAIQEYIGTHPVDMIVMGTRGEGGALQWGSNAEVVARNSTGPVIVVPPDWKAGPIRTILYADDQEEVRDPKALAPLAQLAKRYSASVEFVHVMKEGSDSGPMPVLPPFPKVFEGVDCMSSSIASGDVTVGLMRSLDSGDYGMLAVLHRKLGWVDGLFHRSVAKRMALNTTVPLLVMYE
ncbi:MAG: universal stress protein [Flavobacteriales bacterium]|nr:universal stress protein [Flavobacteriales bacterium]